MSLINQYIVRRSGITSLIFLAFAFVPSISKAQKDTLKAIREFVEICNSYKKVPLHVSLDILKSTDILTSADDTASSSAEFFIRQEGTYTKLDGLEQMVNDSLMLFVSNNDKRMILYPNKTSVSKQLTSYVGFQMQDSSLEKIAKKYKASVLSSDNQEKEAAVIELQSRILVPITALPKELIQISYNQNTRHVLQVVQVQRKLIVLDSVEYNYLLKQSQYTGKLITPGTNKFFLIKTLTTRYMYKIMESDNNIELPVILSSCIKKNENGKYVPINKYEAFKITETIN